MVNNQKNKDDVLFYICNYEPVSMSFFDRTSGMGRTLSRVVSKKEREDGLSAFNALLQKSITNTMRLQTLGYIVFNDFTLFRLPLHQALITRTCEACNWHPLVDERSGIDVSYIKKIKCEECQKAVNWFDNPNFMLSLNFPFGYDIQRYFEALCDFRQNFTLECNNKYHPNVAFVFDNGCLTEVLGNDQKSFRYAVKLPEYNNAYWAVDQYFHFARSRRIRCLVCDELLEGVECEIHEAV